MKHLKRIWVAYFFLIISVSHILSPAFASGGTREWILQFGTSEDDFLQGVFADSTGVYAVGNTRGAFPGNDNLGGVFLAKFDLTGKSVWTKQFGEYEGGNDIFADSTGVYIVGQTHETLPGERSSGMNDAFVAKYSLDGEKLWAQQFGTVGSDRATGIAEDSSGIIVSGFVGAASIGRDTDAFLKKYDFDGNEVWIRQFDLSYDEYAQDVSISPTGIYATGLIYNSTDYWDAYDALVMKYDSGGNLVWSSTIATQRWEKGYSIHASESGVYVTGESEPDVLVLKYDINGTVAWTRRFGTKEQTGGSQIGTGISSDSTGIYIAWTYEGPFSSSYTPEGLNVDVKKYDFDGDEEWTLEFGSPNKDQATIITVGWDGVYVGGRTWGTMPGQTLAGSADAFIAKLICPAPPCPPPVVALSAGLATLIPVVVVGVATSALLLLLLLASRRRTRLASSVQQDPQLTR